jgi:hypothetical protein
VSETLCFLGFLEHRMMDKVQKTVCGNFPHEQQSTVNLIINFSVIEISWNSKQWTVLLETLTCCVNLVFYICICKIVKECSM